MDRFAENGGELFRPRAVQVVRVGEVLDLQIDLALQLVQREIPVFQPVMRGAEVPQRIDVGLIVFGVVQVAAGQRGREQHKPDTVFRAEIGDFVEVFPAKIRQRRVGIYVQQRGKAVLRDAGGIDKAAAPVRLTAVRVDHIAVAVRRVAVSQLGLPEGGHGGRRRNAMARGQQQVGIGRQTAHLRQVGVPVG